MGVLVDLDDDHAVRHGGARVRPLQATDDAPVERPAILLKLVLEELPHCELPRVDVGLGRGDAISHRRVHAVGVLDTLVDVRAVGTRVDSVARAPTRWGADDTLPAQPPVLAEARSAALLALASASTGGCAG
eukprot:303643-Prymnesium_polylepis.1